MTGRAATRPAWPSAPAAGRDQIILGVRPSESGSHDSAFCNHDMLSRSPDRPGLIRHLTNLSAPRLWSLAHTRPYLLTCRRQAFDP